jgi:uncharacterized membrane protein
MRTVAVSIALLLLLFVVLSPVILRSEVPTLFELLLVASAVLGAGLLVRWRGTGRKRALGSILIILGGVSLTILVSLIWLSPRGY